MATLSTVPNAFAQWSQRSKPRIEIPAISVLRPPAKSNGLATASSSFRLVNVGNAHGQRRLPIVFASNSNPSDQDELTEKGDGGAQGPPFLTILAGVVVFLFISWVVGSIVMWLVGLIVNVPPS